MSHVIVLASALSNVVINKLFCLQRSIKTRLSPKFYEVKACTGRKHFWNLTSYEIAIDANGDEYIKDAVTWLYRDIKTLSKASIITVPSVSNRVF